MHVKTCHTSITTVWLHCLQVWLPFTHVCKYVVGLESKEFPGNMLLFQRLPKNQRYHFPHPSCDVRLQPEAWPVVLGSVFVELTHQTIGEWGVQWHTCKEPSGNPAVESSCVPELQREKYLITCVFLVIISYWHTLWTFSTCNKHTFTYHFMDVIYEFWVVLCRWWWMVTWWMAGDIGL